MHNKSESGLQSFIERCRRYGLKLTPQRIALYTILDGVKTHPTAKEVYDEIVKEYPHISIDTVNRTLNTLAEYGFIDVVEGYGEPKRFDPDRESHHHAHCIICGTIIDFQNNRYDELEIPKEITRKFSVLHKRVVLNGICGDCDNPRKS